MRVDAKARRVEDFNHVVVGNQKGRPIELQEVATVVDSIKEKRSLARLDGTDAVALEIQKQSGGNTVAMVEAVKEKLKELQPELAKLGVVTVTGQGQLQVHRGRRGGRDRLHLPGRPPGGHRRLLLPEVLALHHHHQPHPARVRDRLLRHHEGPGLHASTP